jgi:hypothetical protein
LASFAVVALALPATGQNAVPAPRNTAAQSQQVPFTAEYKITRVRTLANGATITRESTEVRAVDSQGRSMTSRTELPSLPEHKPSTWVNVYDPTTGTRTNWNVPGKTAQAVTTPPHDASQEAQCFSTAATAGAATQPAAPRVAGGLTTSALTVTPGPPQPPMSRPAKPVIEDLGTEMIDGVEALGRRVTRTTPVGAVGNNEPLVHVDETWTAKDVGPNGLLVRSVTDDPESGKSTTELVNLSLTEPEASVFMPPEGYVIETQEMHQVSCQTASTPQH